MAIVTAHFSREIRKNLLKVLQNAQGSIYIAVAWFTDDELMSELMSIKTKEPQVDIRVVISNHEINLRNTLPLEDMIDRDIRLRLATNPNILFHHKFCLIDDQILINGSYNWTRLAALSNEENITITLSNPDGESQELFISQFKTMFEKYCRDDYSTPYSTAMISVQDLQTDLGVEHIEQIDLRRIFQDRIRVNMENIRQINLRQKRESQKIQIRIVEDMIKQYGGGVNMVKKLLREENIRDEKGQLKVKTGFRKLVHWGEEQNLSFESMVINPEFQSLFSEDEKRIARRLLQRPDNPLLS